MLWVSFTNEPSSCLPLLAGKISGCNFNPNVTARSRRFEERPRSLNSSLSYSGPWLRGQHNGHRSRGQGERRTQWSVGRLVGWSVGQGKEQNKVVGCQGERRTEVNISNKQRQSRTTVLFWGVGHMDRGYFCCAGFRPGNGLFACFDSGWAKVGLGNGGVPLVRRRCGW